ncbi:large subunit ribosomal protein L29 [Dehalogenimonas formicexedens]|uniref:Large ribosomal subunit protein uL29 n=1 Tax=Dehalogenimonas formicexedens TaxID=1839801 RepID=A0A1P8F521_9CHLR|nr:50S ribosomal protein L29 [Dehalogenimonas formicexedens]APV43563.1 large subunit ribosomal protein L29 [Dehalogenimonas formicexedens]
MKIEEIRHLSAEQIKKEMDAAHREFMELRFKLATKQLVNHRQLPAVKKKIAQFQTVLRERALGIR